MSMQSAGDQSRGSSPEKGIAYNGPFCASSLDWRFNKLLWVNSKMWAGKAADRDFPNTAFIPATGIESVPADSLQNFKRAGFAWRGIDLMAGRVKALVVPAKGSNAAFGNQAV